MTWLCLLSIGLQDSAGRMWLSFLPISVVMWWSLTSMFTLAPSTIDSGLRPNELTKTSLLLTAMAPERRSVWAEVLGMCGLWGALVAVCTLNSAILFRSRVGWHPIQVERMISMLAVLREPARMCMCCFLCVRWVRCLASCCFGMKQVEMTLMDWLGVVTSCTSRVHSRLWPWIPFSFPVGLLSTSAMGVYLMTLFLWVSCLTRGVECMVLRRVVYVGLVARWLVLVRACLSLFGVLDRTSLVGQVELDV